MERGVAGSQCRIWAASPPTPTSSIPNSVCVKKSASASGIAAQGSTMAAAGVGEEESDDGGGQEEELAMATRTTKGSRGWKGVEEVRAMKGVGEGRRRRRGATSLTELSDSSGGVGVRRRAARSSARARGCGMGFSAGGRLHLRGQCCCSHRLGGSALQTTESLTEASQWPRCRGSSGGRCGRLSWSAECTVDVRRVSTTAERGEVVSTGRGGCNVDALLTSECSALAECGRQRSCTARFAASTPQLPPVSPPTPLEAVVRRCRRMDDLRPQRAELPGQASCVRPSGGQAEQLLSPPSGDDGLSARR